MNFFNNKYLYFVLVFLGVLVLDYLLFIWLFSQVFSQPPDNFILGVSSMIGFFILIPAVASYYFVFKSKKSMPVEQILNEKNKKPAIVITIILGMILTLLLTYFTSAGFDPYTLEQISESNFTKPPEIIITKKIDGKEFYIEEGSRGGISLLEKVGQNRSNDPFILMDLRFDPKGLTDFWYDNGSSVLFVVENQNYIEQIFRYPAIDTEYNGYGLGYLVSTENRSSGSISKILDYFSDSDTLIVNSFSGNCGTLDTIKAMTKSTNKILYSGCGYTKGVQFIGYSNGQMYFEEGVFDEKQQWYSSIRRIYSIDVRTNTRRIVIDKELPRDIIYAEMPKGDNKIYLNGKEKRYVFDTSDPAKVNEASESAVSR